MDTPLEKLRHDLPRHYELVREIASGGMSTVYLAQDTLLERPVAVKTLRQDVKNEVTTARLLREARVLAGLRHPNVVAVHHAGEADDLIYYVMDYMEGMTLRERLELGRLSISESIRLGQQVLAAVEVVHGEGIVHRDIKPSNIFLDGEVALLGDFGIAKRLEPTSTGLTDPGHRIGTPGYMAPEQVVGDAVTPATDIHAVGMVLYEALTGRTWSILTPPSEVDWSGVPRSLVPVLKTALRWSPEERWQTAAEFRQALARVRGRKPLAVGGGLLAALILGGALWIWLTSETPPPTARGARQLTFTGDVYVTALSPDGKSVAYATRMPLSDSLVHLFVEDLAGGSSIELAELFGIWAIDWSPDGSELTVVGFAESTGWGHANVPEIFIVPRFGGPLRRLDPQLGEKPAVTESGDTLIPPPSAPSVTWSPDGQKIAFGMHSLFWVIDKVTGEATPTLLSKSFPVSDLAWSPTGSQFAFATHTEGLQGSTLWTVPVTGNEPLKLLEVPERIHALRWSPLNNYLYYMVSRGRRTSDLWKLQIHPDEGSREGAPRLVYENMEFADLVPGGSPNSFTVSSDGRRLAFTGVKSLSNLWLVEIEAWGSGTSRTVTRQLTTGTSVKSHPALSPDGGTVAFSSGSARGSDIFTLSLSGGPPRQLTRMGGTNVTPVWSPSGDRLAFGSNQGADESLWTIDSDGQELRQLAEADLTEGLFLAWEPWDEIIYVRSGSPNSIWSIDPKSGKSRKIAEGPVGAQLFWPRVSPDGQKVVAYVQGSEIGLIVFALGDSSQGFQQVKFKEGFYWPFGWSSDSQWLYAVAIETNFLIAVQSEGEAIDTIMRWPFDDDLSGASVSASADGKRFVSAVREIQSDAWLIENFDLERR